MQDQAEIAVNVTSRFSALSFAAVGVIVLLGSVAGSLIGASITEQDEPGKRHVQVPRERVTACEESDPCWDWQTMGNGTAAATLETPDGTLEGTVTVADDGAYIFTPKG